MKDIIENEFNEHIKVANSIHCLTDAVAISAQLCIDCLKNGGKILLFGNGGSASDAQHIADEVLALSIVRDSTLTVADTEIGVEVVLVKN